MTKGNNTAWLSVVLLASTLLSSVLAAPYAQAFQASGQYASTVIGEPNFVSSTNEVTPNHLYHPFRIAFDSQGDLWVADENNNRVVEFRPPFADGESASLELGQANLTSSVLTAAQDRLNEPVGLAFDSQGDLWVADSVNDRVLEFEPPFTDGMNASLELGQPPGPDEFTSTAASSGANGLYAPVALAFDSHGDLWVTDRENNRILEFEPPFTDGMNASSVIGQANLTYVAPLVSTSPHGLFGPNGIAFDSQGDLWVADESFNRLLEFSASSLGTNDPSAVLEIGQPAGNSEFSTSRVGDSESGLASPLDVAFDSRGDLWVTDRSNNRVLEFEPPFTDGMGASAVLGTHPGPKEFDSNVTGLAQNLFANPLGLAFDPEGDLWVADQANNRVLEFEGAALTTAGTDVDVPTTTELSGLNVTSNGNACYQMAGETTCNLSVNQTSTTGVSMNVIGLASASTANVYSSSLGTSPPTGTAATPLQAGASYYGLSVAGIGDGTATVCVSQPSASSMAYYSGGVWASPTTLSRSGSSICGTIPLSALTSLTTVGAGRRAGPGPSPLSEAASAVGAAAILAVLVSASALVVRRRGRAQVEEGEGTEEEEEQWFSP